MKKQEQQAATVAAQIALGEKYTAPFWDNVEKELTAIEGRKSKPKLPVGARGTKPAKTGHY